MSFGFKLIVPSVLALYVASACTPDLDSLCAQSTCAQATFAANSVGGTGGTDGNPEGGTDSTNNAGSGNATAVDTCTNKVKDSKESDVDCGGLSKCDRCTKNAKCTSNNDCESDYCKNGRCTEPTCTDGVLNQDETGTDCGGSCLPCDIDLPCAGNSDCDGGYCKDMVCTDHCKSGVKEADETDKDCGGKTCGPCADTKGCKAASDCTSKLCVNSSCQKASCTDQVLNQDESDIDCGGACAATKPCSVGLRCNSEADCASWICSTTTAKCVADAVADKYGPNDIIDDFEDGDISTLPALGGRVGNWYAYGDGTGSGLAEALVVNRGASKQALHAKGMNFSKWGSGVGTDINHSSDKLPYDASAYVGVTFWARSATGTAALNVALPDIDTDALTKGKTCTTCDHHYFKAVTATTAWQRFTIMFADLSLESGDAPEPTAFKPGAMSSVQFRFAPGTAYDVYIDDLAFLKP
ncbi:MAG TPA: hypothetical protein VER96_41105 [Polyangiaceae bacterium]|nr:hypothetical protein [Polyangiaceae bacterium]